jgi:hypothetical protein
MLHTPARRFTWRDKIERALFGAIAMVRRDQSGRAQSMRALRTNRLVALHVERQVVGARELPRTQMTLERLLS